VLTLVRQGRPERLLVLGGRLSHAEHLLAVEVTAVHVDDIGERVRISERRLPSRATLRHQPAEEVVEAVLGRAAVDDIRGSPQIPPVGIAL
jgi:hypothetical protein